MTDSIKEISAEDRYNGAWTYWAPGGTIHPTKHDAIGAAAIYGRDAGAGYDVDEVSALRKVAALQPYRCDHCDQGYDTVEEYKDHLEFYEQYSADNPEFDNEHPRAASV